MAVDVNVDFAAPEAWGPDRHERFRWLRENDPVYWAEKSQIWVLTKFDDCAAVSKNQDVFTSAQGVRPDLDTKIGLIDEAEPRHTKLRRLINRGFTPRMVKRWEEVFTGIVTDAMDEFAQKGECDFVADFAVPLPLILIAEMIGIRKEDREKFHVWSDSMIAADGHINDPVIMGRAAKSYLEYSAYVNEIIEDRRREPKDDLVSILVGAKDDGLLTNYDADVPGMEDEAALELANDELLKMLVILLVAGNETTRNGLSGGMQALIENPDAYQRLIKDPSLIGIAVEEMLRWASPVRTFSRTISMDTELRGKKLQAGQRVLMIYTSANRDEEAFENADEFQLERDPKHLAFGLGTHFCLGANLARMEMRVAFEHLLRRIPGIEYASGGPEFYPSPLVRTCTKMNVKFPAERPH